ncbi:tRNA preQ1(34) S-adenosylmethionine ribosyltransferase-isomerase QueA [Chloroflexota bacterium]
MKTSDFDYYLPKELIAQTPIEHRDQSRLMVLNRGDNSIKHNNFFEIIDYLQAGDVLVFNDSRVIPARLSGNKTENNRKLEVLLLRQLSQNTWETLVKPAKHFQIGTIVEITNNSGNGNNPDSKVTAEVVEIREEGIRVLNFSDETLLPQLGKIPIPPYIHVPLQNPERYQTVYAKTNGSAAAPTAGLHFTQELLNEIKRKGIICTFVTLHIGLDTFRPIREENPLKHHIHKEYGILKKETARELSQARKEGRRIICVGTTSARIIEAAAQANNYPDIEPFEDWVKLFIVPGHQFKMIDALITNFHLPKSTLLMLVTAFASNNLIRQAYQEAIEQKYRFYSFGDAMMII